LHTQEDRYLQEVPTLWSGGFAIQHSMEAALNEPKGITVRYIPVGTRWAAPDLVDWLHTQDNAFWAIIQWNGAFGFSKQAFEQAAGPHTLFRWRWADISLHSLQVEGFPLRWDDQSKRGWDLTASPLPKIWFPPPGWYAELGIPWPTDTRWPLTSASSTHGPLLTPHLLDRILQYQDKGLTPEEVHSLRHWQDWEAAFTRTRTRALADTEIRGLKQLIVQQKEVYRWAGPTHVAHWHKTDIRALRTHWSCTSAQCGVQFYCAGCKRLLTHLAQTPPQEVAIQVVGTTLRGQF
jgi:hypothetical protein